MARSLSRSLALPLLALLLLPACADSCGPPKLQGAAPLAPAPTAAPAASDAGGADFFDPNKVFDKAENPEAGIRKVACVGETGDGDSKPFHPQKIRGTVWAPFGKYALRAPDHRPDWQRWMERGLDLVSSPAAAHPMATEKAMAGVTVRLVRVDAHGEVIEPRILEAVTDADGHFCFRVPDGYKIKPDLAVMAGEGPTLMRRNVASRSTNDIFSQPEALFRALVAEKIDLVKLPREEFGNLYSMTDTVVDDRSRPDPIVLAPGTTIAQACDVVQARLQDNERFRQKMAQLKPEYGVTP